MAINNKIKNVNDTLDGIKTPLFIGTLLIWHVLYFAVFFGLAFIDETYIRWLSTAIQIFICLFLLIRFHPFREYSITQFDAIVIFNSATFLLTNVLTTEIFSTYVGTISNKTKQVISNNITTAPAIVSTYAPNPTLQNSLTTAPSNVTTRVPMTSSTPDQQQSTKISYYSP